MEKLYRLKNPIDGTYYCKSADTINFATSRKEAIVYTQKTATRILHDANIMQDLFEEHQGNKQPFLGFELEPTLLEDIYLLPKWKELIKKDAAKYDISIEQATTLFRKQLVLFWSQWADYAGPFDGKKTPSMPSPMEKLILDNKYEF